MFEMMAGTGEWFLRRIDSVNKSMRFVEQFVFRHKTHGLVVAAELYVNDNDKSALLTVTQRGTPIISRLSEDNCPDGLRALAIELMVSGSLATRPADLSQLELGEAEINARLDELDAKWVAMENIGDWIDVAPPPNKTCGCKRNEVSALISDAGDVFAFVYFHDEITVFGSRRVEQLEAVVMPIEFSDIPEAMREAIKSVRSGIMRNINAEVADMYGVSTSELTRTLLAGRTQ